MKKLIILCLLILAGCIQIGDMPQPQNYYLLEAGLASDGEQKTDLKGLNITVESIDLALFLDKPYLVYYNHENQINYQQTERWAEPLDTNINRVIRSNLIRSFTNTTIFIGPWEKQSEESLRIDIAIDDFSSHADNTAKMTVFYQIKFDGKIYNNEYHHSVATGTTVNDQVRGLNKNLDLFCATLVAEISKIMN